jgi:hypothetical protein
MGQRPSRIGRALLVLTVVVGARPLPAQTTMDLGGYISRHGIGVHAGAGVPRVSLFARAERWSTTLQTAGVRAQVIALSDGGIVASFFGGRGSCPSVLFGERGTGCDDRWHKLLGGSLGVEIQSGRGGAVFAEAQRLHVVDASSDIPEWSFAAGYMFRLQRRD